VKLILVILRDPHHEQINRALNLARYSTTLVASTSGWLKKGVTTLLIGVDVNHLEKVMKLIRENCPQHGEPGSHNASLFVLDLEEMVRI
jgi:uncharacterized protein YaaQ